MRSSLLLLAGLASHVLGLPSTSVEDRSIDIDGGADIDIGSIHADLDLDIFIGNILRGGAQSSTSQLEGLGAQAAAALQAGALGCSAGKIHHNALVELKHWLNGAAHLEAGLKKALLHWCDAGAQATLEADIVAGLAVLLPTCSDIVSKGGLYVTIDGIFEAAELEAAAVLSSVTQSSLHAFIEGASHLESEIKAALSLCAGGGVVTSLTEEVKSALKAWLHSSDCGLEHGLKTSVLAWLEGKIESGVVKLGHLSDGSLSSVSVGATLLTLVEESGALVQSARQSLLAFLHSDAAGHLEADIKHVLESCAKGELAKSISSEVRSALAVWLSSSSCPIGAELKSVLLFWLSFALDVDAHLGLDLGIVGDLLSFLTGTLGQILGGGLRGILTILLGGESFLSLTLKARAEIIAIIAGATSIELPSSCITIVIEWITGCIIPGHGSGSSSSMIPAPSSTAPAVSTPAVSTPASTPVVSTSAPAPSGSSPVESSSVPVSSGPASSSPAESTPCDTETFESTTPVATLSPSSSSTPSGAHPVPSASTTPSSSVPVIPGPGSSTTPSSSVPVVPGPSSSAPAESTPCDTETFESTTPVATLSPSSSSTPSGAHPVPSASTTPSSSVPVVPGPGSSAPAESTPCDTETFESTIPVATLSPSSSNSPSGVEPVPTPATTPSSSVPVVPGPESTPCDTETFESRVPVSTITHNGSTSTIDVPVSPATTSAPAPPSGNKPKQTVTVTTTVSIASCV